MTRKKVRHVGYYLRALEKVSSANEADALVTEAARQAPSVISDEDYDRIYWLAQSIIRKENNYA